MQTRAETHPSDLNESVRRYQAGERDPAIELCLGVLERRPEDKQARYVYAVMLLETGRLEGGISELDRLLDDQPDHAEARHSRGMARAKLGDTTGAVEDLERAIALAPAKAETVIALAGVHRRAGDTEQAIAVLRDGGRAAPNHPGLINNLGSLLAETGAFEEIREILEALIARDETSTAGHYNLGKTLKAMNEPETAIRHLARASELDPGFYSAWYNLGNTLLDLGRVDEAACAYERATEIKRQPGEPERRRTISTAPAAPSWSTISRRSTTCWTVVSCRRSTSGRSPPTAPRSIFCRRRRPTATWSNCRQARRPS